MLTLPPKPHGFGDALRRAILMSEMRQNQAQERQQALQNTSQVT
jgi:hypothetical protein